MCSRCRTRSPPRWSRQLKIKLLGAAPTTRYGSKAYALFLQARELMRQSRRAAFEQSIALLQAGAGDRSQLCARRGSGWPSAYSADRRLRRAAPPTRASAGARGDQEGAGDSTRITRQRTRRSALIAMYYDGDLAAAARHLEHALALEPANTDIIGAAAVLARRLGRLDQAIALGEYHVARDPVNAVAH